MRLTKTFTFALLLAAALRVDAQLPDGIGAGTRVRATVVGGASYTGTILQVRRDTIVMRDGGDAPVNIVATKNITALEVSGGRPFRTWSAMKWAGIAGAIVGGVVGYKHYDVTECYPPTTACRNTEIILGGAQGAAIGGVTGYLASVVKGERWQPVAVGSRVISLPAAPPTRPELRSVLQSQLDSFRLANHIPGLTFGIALADGRTIALSSGESDTSAHTLMFPSDRLLEGSVGKTYVAAVAMQLVSEGKLDLDAKIEKYLGTEPWFNRLPNAHDITVRQLMQHTSGLVRYEFQPEATAVMRSQPFKDWTPVDRLSYIFDKTPPFKAGEGWEYSDTNYIVVGMIIEKLLGTTYYDAVQKRVLEPLRLSNTIPSDRRQLPGVVNGYAGPKNDLGGYDASMKDGLMQVNPQFEWTGGGMASTAEDLARWGKMLYEGKAFDSKLLPTMLTGVPAKLGPNTKYGLGVIIRESPDGVLYGHSGFFPGYATEMLYNPRTKTAVAIQANITQPYPRGLVNFLTRALSVTSSSM